MTVRSHWQFAPVEARTKLWRLYLALKKRSNPPMLEKVDTDSRPLPDVQSNGLLKRSDGYADGNQATQSPVRCLPGKRKW
jgi:hypothetical protein